MNNTIRFILNLAALQLGDADIKTYRQEAEILIAESLGKNRIDLYLNEKQTLDPQMADLIQKNCLLRQTGYPLQYITGKSYFYGLEFKVNENVFIPRPETEILVEAVLNKLSPPKILAGPPRSVAETLNSQPSTVLEIGTGCGNIAVSLTKNFPYCRIIATDISENALAVAKINSNLHGAQDSIKFVCGNLFDMLKNNLKFDFIISNPPYIRSCKLKKIPKELQYEPPLSLDGKEDGLFFQREIIRNSPRYLKDGGFLALELGDDQSDKVNEILKDSSEFKKIEFIEDYNKVERIVVAQKDG